MPHRQRPEEIAPLRHERNAVGEKLARRLAVDTLALESEFARTWNEHAEQRLQHRRFAGAVWTDQQRDLGAAGIERGPAQDREARRVASHDVVELDDLVGHETGALNFPQFPSISLNFPQFPSVSEIRIEHLPVRDDPLIVSDKIVANGGGSDEQREESRSHRSSP